MFRFAPLVRRCVPSVLCLIGWAPIRVHADTPVAPDEGKFVILLQESEIGTETFKTSANGQTEFNNAINLGGQKIEGHSIEKFANGKLVSIFTEAKEHGHFSMTIEGTKGKLTIMDKPGKDQTFPTRIFPMSNFAPHLYSYLIAAYDSAKGGPQKFDMAVIDGVGAQGLAMVKVTLTELSAKPRQVGGKTLPISRYALIFPGPIGNIDTEVDADATGRILLWSVPGQKLTAVRDGYQELAQPDAPSDPLLSKPTYSVKVETKVMIAMRDGVKLATDIYRPDAEGKFPVILQRTPYGRGNALEASFYAKRGYVFVAQDVRGRYDSEGDFHPFVLEAKDGYDAVEWCALQPWSTGDVGMIGASYLGLVQWAAAREGSTHLKCLIPIVSPPDPFFNVPYASGALFLGPDLWWVNVVKDRAEMHMESPATTMKNLDAFMTLPLKDVDKAVLGQHIPFFQEWLQHSSNDAYYEQVNFNDKMKDFGPLPALNVSGWFDGDGIGTKRNYAAMVASGHANQKLIYGPWGHAVNTTTKVGPFDFGPQSLRDLDTLYLRWFDRWLKGVENGVEKEPSVDAFLMGRNEWRTFDAWPPKEASLQKWYLHSGGHANANRSDGTLSTTLPSATETADHYSYNPAKPYIPGATKQAIKRSQGEDATLAQADLLPDLLNYTTPVLTQDLIVAGPISAHLVAATSAKDTDWFAMLQDVYPDGKVATLCQGIIRARFRKSFTTPTLLQPNEVADYDIDLWALGNVFQKGHRLRLVITSSCFPEYDRNLNTGGDIATGTAMVTAKQTVYHTAVWASYVLLPVLGK